MRLSLIGLGTVGQGVVELLRRHRDLYAVRCGHPLDIVGVLVRDASRRREFGPPPGALVTADASAFFGVPSDIVVEVAGGLEPARALVVRALESGRDVVTANKALLAAHAPDLFALAERHRRRLAFEASVAGGVPVIQTVTTGLASARLEGFLAILNGTCNFILTAMAAGGSYEQALAEAQRRGFAEADPSLDVSGRDSLEKLAILAALAFGCAFEVSAIPSGGIEGCTPVDLRAAAAMKRVCKLVAGARRRDDGRVELWNGPAFLPAAHPLAHVDGSDMGLFLTADVMKSAFITGDGAGRFPTASAVVSDVLGLARLHACRDTRPLNPWPLGAGPRPPAPPELARSRFYVRVGPCASAARDYAAALLARHGLLDDAPSRLDDCLTATTRLVSESEMSEAEADLRRADAAPTIVRIAG